MSRPSRVRRPGQHSDNHRHKRNRFRFRRTSLEHLELRCLLTAVPYTWNDAQIGAGGFLDGVFFDPSHNGTMYARTDIGGLYKTTDGGNHWFPLLDFVGISPGSSGNGTQGADMQVLAFAMDPQDTDNIYALTGGGVLYSTNAGQTWGITNLSFSVNGNGVARATGERIAVDPYDSNIVFVGSNAANGLWESTNAGHSFTQVSSFSTAAPITFILFDPYGGSAGNPTQTIFVGQASAGSGSNIYQTANGGTSWTQVANAGGPASFYPMRAAYDSADDGNVYFTFSNQLPPEGTLGTNGAVYRYNVNTTTWANITPTIPAGGGTATSEWVGLGVDAENPGTIVVTTFDHYNGGDYIFRTTNANAATPTWVGLFGGYNTRNTSQAPYMAQFTDWIGNWAATTAIDPFNPAHIVYGTGQGLWTTLTGNSNTQLTAPNSWYFMDYGIDFTAVIGLNAAPSGVPLFSAVGDIDGFAHSTITSSPAAGAILPGGSIGNMTSVDFAGTNPNYVATVGTTGSRDGGYSTNNGLTWTEFTAKPTGSGGTVAVTMNSTNNGMVIVWAPSSRAPSRSTNNGSTWTASTGGAPTGGKVFADRQTPGVFYYYVSNKLWVSTDYGASFTQKTSTNLPSGGAIVVNPFLTGDLWVAANDGIYRSSDSGTNWSKVGSLTLTGNRIALGAPAPGQTVPAIYVYTAIPTFAGYYRSDDGGITWVQINDVNHQWGGYITYDNGGAFGLMAADSNVYGRVYLATNGRGVIVGNPTSSLPAGWTDADINLPGNPGWSTSSETLSDGSTVNQWIVNGGGAGISSTSDQFNFAYKSITGGGSISAQIVGMNNADGTNNVGASNGTPSSGVMFRAGTNAGDVYAAIVQTTDNQLLFQYRTTTDGSVSTTSLGSVPVGAEYVELARSGSNFTAYYSADGINWTQLGSSVAIAAIPNTADVGLAATANFNSQLTSAKFANVVIHLKGDINLDGHVNAADIGALMQALADTNTYQTTNNLSPTEAVVVADVSGDGFVNNFDLQALLSQLISGGGSSSQGENASTAAAAPIVPTLIPSVEVVNSAPASAPVPSSTPASTADSSDPTAAKNLSAVRSALLTSIASTSDSSVIYKHSGSLVAPASATNTVRDWFTAVDRYYDRLDQPVGSLSHARVQRSLGSHHLEKDDGLSDSCIEQLSDFA